MVRPQWSGSSSDEVDQLLLNARLRDELEPFLDESMDLVNARAMSTPQENEYLASMLAWERAPVLPIAEWFQPPLALPAPDTLRPDDLSRLLFETIQRLYDKQIALDFTDHLSDHELYCLILRDILPSLEKKLDKPTSFLHWHCLDPNEDPDIWLRYYASCEEREAWAEEYGESPPTREPLPYPRQLPRA